MADYIRGKKAYTKWDVDAENVDMDLPSDGHHLHHKPKVVQHNCFTGRKGKALKGLFVAVVFLSGLVLGYVLRRGVHEVVHEVHTECFEDIGTYMYKEYNGRFIKKHISNSSIAQYMKTFSSAVHMAGTASNKEFASTISKMWRDFGFQNVRSEKFTVLLSHPSNVLPNTVQITNGKTSQIDLTGTVDATLDLATLPYIAFSPNKSCSGKPVYANLGRQEDFEYLKSKGIVINGSVIVVRNGVIHRGHKVKMAEEYGAVGVILYSDPASVVPNNTQFAPSGIALPGDGVTRGSLKLTPGDLQTPHTPSIDGIYRLPISKLNLPSIPVHPISYNDARLILDGMTGPEAPLEWQGNLNVTYKLGPGYDSAQSAWEVNMTMQSQLVQKEIFNVIATIPGEYEPGRYVIVGCHHDSWTNGTSDPNSGMAILMELARVFGKLHKELQWKPGRTLVFASWDAEEFGITGSMEWVQAHAKELLHRAVAYINLDVAISGNYSLMALGSPLLRQVLKEAASDVKCHVEGHSDMLLYDMWKSRMPLDSNVPSSIPEIGIPGSGSDFVSFFTGSGISSVHLQFVDKNLDGDYPLYHTSYDLYDVMSNEIDREFKVAASLAQVVALALLKLTDNLHLPMRTEDYSDQVKRDLMSFAAKYGKDLADHGIFLESLEKSLEAFTNACHEFHDNYGTVNRNNLLLALRQYNDRLIELERAFLLPPGTVPEYPNFRHAIYGPNPKNVYEGVAFPHLVASIQDAQLSSNNPELWDKVQEQLSYVIYALRSAEGVLNNYILLKKDEL